MQFFSSAHKAFQQHGILTMVACWLLAALPLLVIAGRAPSDIGISLIALLFLAYSAAHKTWDWKAHGWVKAVALLWCFMLIASLFADNPAKAAGRAAAWVRYPIFAIALAYWLLPIAKACTTLRTSMVVSLLFLLADGFLQYATGTDLFGRAIVQHETIFRLTGPFSSPRLGITLVWLCLPVACWLLARGKQLNPPMISGIAAMAATMVLVYVSGERMATLFMLFAAIAILLLCQPLRLRITLASLVALAAIYGFNQQDAQITHRQMNQTEQEISGFFESAYGRAWESAIMVWHTSPVIGVGAKHFEKSCNALAETQHYPNGTKMFCPMHPHNVVLEWLVYYGAIGLALFMLVLGCWLRMAWQHRHRIMADALCCGLFITLCIRFFPIASTASQFTAWSAVPLWLCVGWLIARLNKTEA